MIEETFRIVYEDKKRGRSPEDKTAEYVIKMDRVNHRPFEEHARGLAAIAKRKGLSPNIGAERFIGSGPNQTVVLSEIRIGGLLAESAVFSRDSDKALDELSILGSVNYDLIKEIAREYLDSL